MNTDSGVTEVRRIAEELRNLVAEEGLGLQFTLSSGQGKEMGGDSPSHDTATGPTTPSKPEYDDDAIFSQLLQDSGNGKEEQKLPPPSLPPNIQKETVTETEWKPQRPKRRHHTTDRPALSQDPSMPQ